MRNVICKIYLIQYMNINIQVKIITKYHSIFFKKKIQMTIPFQYLIHILYKVAFNTWYIITAT